MSDDAVVRKAGPIYDAIESRSFKNAAKLADQILKKHPDHPLLLALKCYALLHNRAQPEYRDDGLKILARLKENPAIVSDPETLNLVGYNLRAARDFLGLADLYDRAAMAAAPGSKTQIDMLEQLYSAHLGQFALTKMQPAASRLTRAAPSDGSYTWWGVASLLLQAREAAFLQLRPSPGSPSPQLTADKFLDMALTVIERRAMPPGGAADLPMEPLLLYIEALRAAGRYGAAAEVVRGASKALPIEADRRRLEAVCLMDAAAAAAAPLPPAPCPQAADLFRSVLAHNPDDWDALCGVLDCVWPRSAGLTGTSKSEGHIQGALDSLVIAMKKLRGEIRSDAVSDAGDAAAARDAVAGNFSEPWSAEADSMAKEAVALLEARAASDGEYSILRAPGLAKIELALRKGDYPEASDAILSHLTARGHMVSCPADVSVFLRSLPDAELAKLSAELTTRLRNMGVPAAQNGSVPHCTLDHKTVRHAVTALSLLHEAGAAAGGAAALEPASLLRLYGASRPLFDGLDSREPGPVDEIPAFAASTDIRAALSDTTSAAAPATRLLLAMAGLDGAKSDRPYNARLLVPLASAWSLLGSPGDAAQTLEPLELKNIQHDTVSGHLLLPALLAFPGQAQAAPLARLLRESLLLYSNLVDVEAGEAAFKALKQGTYSKVVEICDFRERLEASHCRAVCRVEQVLGGLRDSVATPPEAIASAARFLKLLWEGPSLLAAPASAAGTQPPQLAAALRFNEDLNVRPEWYGPEALAGGPRLAVARWWEARAASAAAAASPSRLQWRRGPGSAERPPLNSWRQDCTAALIRRWQQAGATCALLQLAIPVPAPSAGPAELGVQYVASLTLALITRLPGSSITMADALQSAHTEPMPALSDQLSVVAWAVLHALEAAAVILAEARAPTTPDDNPVPESCPIEEDEGTRALLAAGVVSRTVAVALAALQRPGGEATQGSVALASPSAVSVVTQLAQEDLALAGLLVQTTSKGLASVSKTVKGRRSLITRIDASLRSVKSLGKALQDGMTRLATGAAEAAAAVKATLPSSSLPSPGVDPERRHALEAAFPSGTPDPVQLGRRAARAQAELLEGAAKAAKAMAGAIQTTMK